MADAAASFLPHRASLVGLAYRMTGSHATAEDIVQEVYLRWDAAERTAISLPRPWLMKAAARLAIDHLRSAQVRREAYVGPWLPEPLLEDRAAPQEEAWARAESVSLAFLLTLERLSPPERAIFILHDLFEMPFNELAPLLHKSEAACRQLAVRARHRLGEPKPRHEVSEADGTRLAKAFLVATQAGNEVALRDMLAEDVILHTDGGGNRPAALNLIYGAEKTARILAQLALKKVGTPISLYCGRINGMPGFVTKEPDGLPQVTVLEVEGTRIVAVYMVRNPEKLGAIAAALGL